jgi:hypothetical protein
METFDHVTPGAKLMIIDDCTFKVTNFTYDGLAPDALFVGGSNTTLEALAAGPVLTPAYEEALTDEDVTVKLPSGAVRLWRGCRCCSYLVQPTMSRFCLRADR